jgi:photosynthetic reaction center cytochrome c subunit
MSGKFRVAVLRSALALAILSSLGTFVAGQSILSQPAGGAPKTTEQAFKNIKVLKGVPADQLIPAMQFTAASLGVECDFCHVQGHFDQDDKKPKETARKMMTMMFAINKDNFNGERKVTCYSCHRGSVKPTGTPIIAEEGTAPMIARSEKPMSEGSEEEAKPDLSKLPSPKDLIEKYVQALGGEAAIKKISSRTEKGSLIGFGGKFPVEVFAKAPDASLTLTHLPNGDSVTVYDGHEGWMTFPGRPPRPMEGADREAAKTDSDLHFAIDLETFFSEFKKAPEEKIRGQQTYQILALNKNQPPVQLYFDEQSGLLVRLLRYAESPLGLYPTQIDYADYRDQDGVRVPFRWTTARPGGSSTIQLDQVQQNVPVDDAKFAKPPAPAKKANQP